MSETNTLRIDRTVRTLLKASGAPGCAIAVFHDQDLCVQGYGVKEHGKPEWVTPDTLFANVSTTKAVTTAAMARLVGENKFIDENKRLCLDWNPLRSPLRHQTFTTFLTSADGDHFQNVEAKFHLSPTGAVECLELFDGSFARRAS